MSGLTIFRENRAAGWKAPGHRPSARTLRMTIGSMAVPDETCLTIPLQPDADHPAQCCIVLSDPSGWDVRLEVDGRVIARMHCADWHHVERICSTLTTNWTARHTEPSARK